MKYFHNIGPFQNSLSVSKQPRIISSCEGSVATDSWSGPFDTFSECKSDLVARLKDFLSKAKDLRKSE